MEDIISKGCTSKIVTGVKLHHQSSRCNLTLVRPDNILCPSDLRSFLLRTIKKSHRLSPDLCFSFCRMKASCQNCAVSEELGFKLLTATNVGTLAEVGVHTLPRFTAQHWSFEAIAVAPVGSALLRFISLGISKIQQACLHAISS